MTRMLSAADPAPLIVFAVLVLVAAVLAVETGRRRLKCWKADRTRAAARAAKLAEDAKMATRAGLERTSFVRAAERRAALNATVADRELEVAWPTVGDLAAAADGSAPKPPPVIHVPSPRARLYVVPQLPEAASA
jgi:hypothetical protein